MIFDLRAFLAVLMLLGAPAQTLAQGAQVAFGGLKQDPTLPVEVTADQLRVNQADGTAIFTGNVVVGQGQMRLSADRVQVEYAAQNSKATGHISRLRAEGNVVLVSGAEAAEAQTAIYTIDSGNVVMTGNVVLTQGENALSSQRMVVDLTSGVATMEGRVKSILKTGGN